MPKNPLVIPGQGMNYKSALMAHGVHAWEPFSGSTFNPEDTCSKKFERFEFLLHL